MLIDVLLSLWLSLAVTTFMYITYVLYEAKHQYEIVNNIKPSFSISFWIYYTITIFSVCLMLGPLSFMNITSKKQRLFKELYRLVDKYIKEKGNSNE
jgi:hypothetical protein